MVQFVRLEGHRRSLALKFVNNYHITQVVGYSTILEKSFHCYLRLFDPSGKVLPIFLSQPFICGMRLSCPHNVHPLHHCIMINKPKQMCYTEHTYLHINFSLAFCSFIVTATYIFSYLFL